MKVNEYINVIMTINNAGLEDKIKELNVVKFEKISEGKYVVHTSDKINCRAYAIQVDFTKNKTRVILSAYHGNPINVYETSQNYSGGLVKRMAKHYY